MKLAYPKSGSEPKDGSQEIPSASLLPEGPHPRMRCRTMCLESPVAVFIINFGCTCGPVTCSPHGPTD